MGLPVLSHSEVDTFLLCERRHFYAFGERLQRKQHSASLATGILGHDVMEHVLTALKDGASWDSIDKHIQAALTPHISTGEYETIEKVLGLVAGFFDSPPALRLLRDSPIVFVEKEFRLPFPDMGFEFACKIDLGVEVQKRLEIWDWKFTYDFYSPDSMPLKPQLRRYYGVLKELGWNVHNARYAMLRTRKTRDGEGYRISDPVPMRKELVLNTFRDMMIAAERILNYKALPLETWKSKVVRTSNEIVCKHCSFKNLCIDELNGFDGNSTRAALYERNEYGYGESE